jgi:antitoxin component of RelBE/YafQ-DinJ toxin-antitoxin module
MPIGAIDFVKYWGKKPRNAGLAAGRCRLKIMPMVDRALIACSVTSETKARVRALAEREGITESTLVRQLLDTVLRTSLSGGGLELPLERVSRPARLYVRLAAEDWALLKARASARGLACATYVALVTRSHLRGAPPVPKAEFIALRQAVTAVTALGRTLNQIARALNQGGKPELPARSAVDAMVKIAGALRDHFRALLVANEQSWRGHEKSD